VHALLYILVAKAGANQLPAVGAICYGIHLYSTYVFCVNWEFTRLFKDYITHLGFCTIV